jgi:hypothetical protein
VCISLSPATTACGTDCDAICYEDLQCGPPQDGKQFQPNTTTETACGTSCDTTCFEDSQCGGPPPAGIRFQTGAAATTVCGVDCDAVCFEDGNTCGPTPTDMQFQPGATAATKCDGDVETACNSSCFEERRCGPPPTGMRFKNEPTAWVPVTMEGVAPALPVPSGNGVLGCPDAMVKISLVDCMALGALEGHSFNRVEAWSQYSPGCFNHGTKFLYNTHPIGSEGQPGPLWCKANPGAWQNGQLAVAFTSN